MTQSTQDKLHAALAMRKAAGTYRQLHHMRGIDFSSNDYLGLAQCHLNIDETLSGSTGSRLITGHDENLSELEAHIAKFHGFDNALLFSSGYAANTGLLACLGTADDVIISDELIHASLIDGIRLSYAQRTRFKHNDLTDLERQLIEHSHDKTGQIYVVIEALYSMDGDVAPLSEMANMCEKYGAALIVDEAHSNGIYGPNGAGLIAQFGLQDKILASIYTFGKALGLHGAVICGSDVLKDYLINFCRTFIYTTAPSPYMRAATQQAYERLKLASDARETLTQTIKHFQSQTARLSVKSAQWIESDSPIQGLILPGNDRARSLANYLQDQGFAIKAILSPTVQVGTERLRISLHSFNTPTQIDELISAIQRWFTQFDSEQAA